MGLIAEAASRAIIWGLIASFCVKILWFAISLSEAEKVLSAQTLNVDESFNVSVWSVGKYCLSLSQ